MKYSFLILLTISSFLFSCNDSSSDDDRLNRNENIQTAEDKALMAVESLPEFKDANIQINALTNGTQSITCIIDSPTEDDPNFYIQAGYNQESWFEPYYTFVVNERTFEVYIEDVVEGDIVSMHVWRNREKHR